MPCVDGSCSLPKEANNTKVWCDTHLLEGPLSHLRVLSGAQAGAGLVADSVPIKEFEECVNKAAALGRAIDLAEQAFVDAT